MMWDISSIIATIAMIWAIIEFRNNRRLRRKERTFDVFPALREEFFDLKQKIYVNDVLTTEGEQILRKYLSKMERFAVGVHCKLYDLPLINRMSGRVLIGQYKSFIREYIAKRKKDGMADTTYCEYEQLIAEIADLREKEKSLFLQSDISKSESPLNKEDTREQNTAS